MPFPDHWKFLSSATITIQDTKRPTLFFKTLYDNFIQHNNHYVTRIYGSMPWITHLHENKLAWVDTEGLVRCCKTADIDICTEDTENGNLESLKEIAQKTYRKNDGVEENDRSGYEAILDKYYYQLRFKILEKPVQWTFKMLHSVALNNFEVNMVMTRKNEKLELKFYFPNFFGAYEEFCAGKFHLNPEIYRISELDVIDLYKIYYNINNIVFLKKNYIYFLLAIAIRSALKPLHSGAQISDQTQKYFDKLYNTRLIFEGKEYNYLEMSLLFFYKKYYCTVWLGDEIGFIYSSSLKKMKIRAESFFTIMIAIAKKEGVYVSNCDFSQDIKEKECDPIDLSEKIPELQIDLMKARNEYLKSKKISLKAKRDIIFDALNDPLIKIYYSKVVILIRCCDLIDFYVGAISKLLPQDNNYFSEYKKLSSLIESNEKAFNKGNGSIETARSVKNKKQVEKKRRGGNNDNLPRKLVAIKSENSTTDEAELIEIPRPESKFIEIKPEFEYAPLPSEKDSRENKRVDELKKELNEKLNSILLFISRFKPLKIDKLRVKLRGLQDECNVILGKRKCKIILLDELDIKLNHFSQELQIEQKKILDHKDKINSMKYFLSEIFEDNSMSGCLLKLYIGASIWYPYYRLYWNFKDDYVNQFSLMFVYICITSAFSSGIYRILQKRPQAFIDESIYSSMQIYARLSSSVITLLFARDFYNLISENIEILNSLSQGTVNFILFSGFMLINSLLVLFHSFSSGDFYKHPQLQQNAPRATSVICDYIPT